MAVLNRVLRPHRTRPTSAGMLICDRSDLASALILGTLLLGLAVAFLSCRRKDKTPPVPAKLVRNAVAPMSARTQFGILYPGLPGDHLLASGPTVPTRDGSEVPLRDGLLHLAGDNAWREVVADFYRQAAVDPAIAAYFTDVDMEALQRHFLRALMIVTSHGVNVGVVRHMRDRHAHVRNPDGAPIDASTWDAVAAVLTNVLAARRIPPTTLAALAATLAPIRAAIVPANPAGPTR